MPQLGHRLYRDYKSRDCTVFRPFACARVTASFTRAETLSLSESAKFPAQLHPESRTACLTAFCTTNLAIKQGIDADLKAF